MNGLTVLTTGWGGHPAVVGVAGVLTLAVVWLIVRSARRLIGNSRPEDVLTVIAASIATAVAMTGMWKFFGDQLGISGPLRGLLFAFIEVAVFTSALRARRNVQDPNMGTAGADGAAVWALTGLSAVLSATDADHLPEALFRLAAPLVAAWLWERSMAVERRRATGQTRTKIHWRITPERILVRIGLAEATDRTATEVDAHRRLARLARAAKKVRALRTTGAANWRQRRALGRLDRAMGAAVEHAGLAGDPARRDLLMGQLAALYNAAELAELTPPTPWTYGDTTTQQPRTARTECSRTRELNAGTKPQPRTDGRSLAGAGRTDTADTEAAPQLSAARPACTPHRRKPDPGQSGTAPLADRDVVVAELAAEILAAGAAGHTWAPDYAALMKRAGRKRSWCEKAVREARTIASQKNTTKNTTGNDTRTPATRTDDGPQHGTPSADVLSRTEPPAADAGVVVPLTRTGGDR